MSPQYYFPTVVGTKWTYDDSINREGGYGEVITKSEKKDGRFIVTVKSTSLDWVDSDATTIAQYIVSKDGVFLSAELLESDDHKAFHDPPICLLKLPFKKGDKWDRDAKTGKWPPVAVKAENKGSGRDIRGNTSGTRIAGFRRESNTCYLVVCPQYRNRKETVRRPKVPKGEPRTNWAPLHRLDVGM